MRIAAKPAPAQDALNSDLMRIAIEGLTSPQKTLPCALFYDARGSALFELITEQPEYYPTRTETAILAARAGEIAAEAPDGCILVEFGSGSSRKTEILIEALPNLFAYIPIDVSLDALAEARERLASRFPKLRVIPIVADFVRSLALPPAFAKRPLLGFFPGSTIGNFGPAEACALLKSMASILGEDGRLIVGVDLLKDLTTLVPAYNDAAGVTAQFNLNLLVRMNREIGADFDLDQFSHLAHFNAAAGRIEMHLVSLAEQTVAIGGHRFRFAEGERIHTENSYKYTVAQFRALASSAGWTPHRIWTDSETLFGIFELMRVP